MRIGFWNTQNSNPVAIAERDKGSDIYTYVKLANVDVMIFCEVLDLALDDLDIQSFQQDMMLNKEANLRGLPSLLPTTSQGDMASISSASDLMDYTFNKDSRRPHKFGGNSETLRRNSADMMVIEQAVSLLSSPSITDKRKILKKQPSIARSLKESSQSYAHGLLSLFECSVSRDVIQSDRNMIVFSNELIKSVEFLNVTAKGAKREILDIVLANGRRILTVHAPSYGKGGAETVEQIAQLINASPKNTIGIGDFNIDLDELIRVTEFDVPPTGIGLDLSCMRKRHDVQFFAAKSGGGDTIRRRWHPNREPEVIKKHYLPTQKSGGTLDYVVAAANSITTVEIGAPMGVLSDHAMIVADIR